MSATAPTMHTVEIEEGGRILRAIAVPYGAETVVIGPGRRGEAMAHRESFDAESILHVGALFGKPLLVGHDQTRPTGRVLSSRSTERGLEIEAELLGSDQELESIRRRAAGGVLSHLSIGFLPDRKRDIWHKPDATGLPLVLRRGAQVREVSLVLWPAFDGARVLGIHARTAAAVARKASSDATIAEIQAMQAEIAPILAKRRR
jgi:HK97 family phage prohead protease